MLLDTATTGCADPAAPTSSRAAAAGRCLFLHGWTCRGTDLPCAGRGKWDHKPRQRGVRAMYAAKLGWLGGVPQVTGWLRAALTRRGPRLGTWHPSGTRTPR